MMMQSCDHISSYVVMLSIKAVEDFILFNIQSGEDANNYWILFGSF